MRRSRNRPTFVLSLGLALLVVGAPVALATRTLGRPDLVETAVSSSVPSTMENKPFRVHDRVVNRGLAAAKPSLTRYFIKRGGTRVPIGLRKVPRLAPGKSSAGTGEAIVPSGIPAGAYPLLACANSAGTIKESNTRNNCLTAAHKLKVTKPKPVL
ncbi:MAG TPA: CARDB domain-containing protein [Gaiellaceae bacterium]